MKKTAKNDITGAWIVSKPNTEDYQKNWDRIFGKKKALEKSIEENKELYKDLSCIDVNEQNFDDISKKKFKCNGFCGHYECLEHQEECIRINKKSRIDIIGQNGNEGIHYEIELNKSTGEPEKTECIKGDNNVE